MPRFGDALASLLNTLAPPSREDVGVVVGALGVAAAVWVIAVGAAHRRPRAATGLAALAAACVGLVAPNLVYVSVAANGLRSVAFTLLGRPGSNTDGGGLVVINDLVPGRPWLPLLALAPVGLAVALRRRETDAVVWMAAVVATWAFAAGHVGTLRYFVPAVVLSIPLALRVALAAGKLGRVAAVAVAALLAAVPIHAATADVRTTYRHYDAVHVRNAWVRAHMTSSQVTLTELPGDDALYMQRMLRFTPWAPVRNYRLVVASSAGRRFLEERNARIRFVMTAPHSPPVSRLLETMGVKARVLPVAQHSRMYEVLEATQLLRP